MNRNIIIAALGIVSLGVSALPAAAASVTVNVANLDAKTAHAKIAEAAQKVCHIEMADSSPLDRYDMIDCVADTTAAAEAQLAARRTTLAKL